jgi:general L-amino acid transport system permease protein
LTNVLWILYFPLVLLLIRGFGESFEIQETPLATVPTRFWGGLLLSLLLAIVGIVFSFPIGVILALGRQSKLPVMRTFSILYIEFIRGVPLISLLFMGQVMLNLFLPSGITLDRVFRAMVPITLFSAAYLAENVRGGLQSIPKGQYEAAYALGLSGFKTMLFIILPQALRAVIPVIVGQFIGLFKDTSLVAIVGLLDLLGIARGVIANPDYIGTQREVFLFISVFYFVFSYALAYTSRRLETALGVGTR